MYFKYVKKISIQNRHNLHTIFIISYFVKKEAKIKKSGQRLGLQRNNLDLDTDDVGIKEIVNNNFEYYELAYYPNKEVNIEEMEI